ncbi:unnamed protein product [Schistosoma curassoni]|uniref:ATP citrate synthase n=1 Tax=Schistosoma curassoni TaxID=6186 RepID=A0A183KHY5_9TREM|nr:unnamed protein product [Schistosoma curassoni]
MSSKAVYEESAKLLIYNSICYSKLAKNPLRVVKVGDDVSLVTDEWILLNDLVSKPDVLIKRRGKLGLVFAGFHWADLQGKIKSLLASKFTIGSTSGILDRFLIEPFVPHEQQEEYYLCMYTQRNSNVILFHHAGGVDVGEVDSKFGLRLKHLKKLNAYINTSTTFEINLKKKDLDCKVLLIGGGIANFTNIAATFKGIVRALTEFKEQLKRHNIRIFVRRAGPNYQEGLRVMRELGRIKLNYYF